MQVDIYLREKRGDREIRFPLIPEEIVFKSGDAMGVTYEIMNVGEVVVPTGTQLDSYSWKGEFPGELRQNDPMLRGTWEDPRTYDSILRDWLKTGKELNLLVTGYPINADVHIKEYHSSAAGAFGDIYYEIGFMEARSVVISRTSGDEEPTAEQPDGATGSGANGDQYEIYVIVSGDTLWSIARKFFGTATINWKKIYEANKETIEAAARDHGRESSDNGRWIYPGTSIRIPLNGVYKNGAKP